MYRLLPALALQLIAASTLALSSLASQSAREWPAYGRDPGGARNSPLTQITRDNVASLSVAWTQRTGELARSDDRTRFETTPLMVDGVLYLSTPFGRVMALDPATGRLLWNYDGGTDATAGFGDPATRGVSTWLDHSAATNAPCRRRIYLATLDARIVALDAKSGAPCRDFGSEGTVSLRKGLRNAPFETGEYELTSPPAVIGGMIVTGSSVGDNNRTNAASGEVRAFDTESGAELWRGQLPAGARATPMTYSIDGRQYVVICVGGGDDWGRGDYVVAFALPR